MIQLKEAGNIFASIAYLMNIIGDLKIRLSQLDPKGVVHLPLEPLQKIEVALARVGQTAETCGMNVPSIGVRDAIIILQNRTVMDALSVTYPPGRLDDFIKAVEYIVASFRDEMNCRYLFIMNAQHINFYNPENPLFGSAVEDAFPSAAFEIADAGRCRAVGQWTACVMHLMRAIENPLNKLAERYAVAVGQNWNTALNQIDAALKNVTRSASGAAAEQWASEASAHLRVIKNAWRNYSQHGMARYDEAQVIAIWGNVESLMRTLAVQLSE